MLTVNYINTVLYNYAINTRIHEHSQYEQAVEDTPHRSIALKTRLERIENAGTHRVRRAGTSRTPSRKSSHCSCSESRRSSHELEQHKNSTSTALILRCDETRITYSR